MSASSLSESDLSTITRALKRAPSELEKALFATLWSEHCSYRSSKALLKKLGTFAENAGVVEISAEYAAVFKVESHNHPSFLNPKEGAATGLGGIERDVLSMGARPVAGLSFLRFNDHSNLKEALEGIENYAKETHIQDLGANTGLSQDFEHNVLVNACALGVVEKRCLVHAKAKEGALLVLIGKPSGSEGLDGARMSSQALEANTNSNVPKGDGKLQAKLIEACLQIYHTLSVVGAQDLGAGGLATASAELAFKGGCGVSLELENVPTYEPLELLALLLNETQERMLLSLMPIEAIKALEISAKYGLKGAIVGQITPQQDFIATYQNKPCVSLPLSLLLNPPLKPLLAKPTSFLQTTYPQNLLNSQQSLETKRIWIPEINNHLMITLASSTPLSIQNPREDSKRVFVRACRDLVLGGAKILGVSDGINLASVEEDAWVLEEMLGGLIESQEALKVPVVSGNVSLNNETHRDNKVFKIPPTLVLVAVGLCQYKTIPKLWQQDGLLYLLKTQRQHLEESLLKQLEPIDLIQEKHLWGVLYQLLEHSLIASTQEIIENDLLLTLSQTAQLSQKDFVLDAPIKSMQNFSWTQTILVEVPLDKEANFLEVVGDNCTKLGRVKP
ncbi:AIR synthase related protein [Helicobacter suis]|uniref:AIR synthase related protein n=1 Tax=Helicobacter suis TaxID=104628 RepID=UPI0002F3BE30|nr:AIR synthase related protein [Helicobacter suis]BDR28038.1 phosphoribosylformylglycinamidine synthase subunit PurL [Helicobacter suis HS1]